MLLLGSNIHGKTSQKVKTDDILKACVCYLQICTHVSILHLCYNFALVLHENALIFKCATLYMHYYVCSTDCNVQIFIRRFNVLIISDQPCTQLNILWDKCVQNIL